MQPGGSLSLFQVTGDSTRRGCQCARPKLSSPCCVPGQEIPEQICPKEVLRCVQQHCVFQDSSGFKNLPWWGVNPFLPDCCTCLAGHHHHNSLGAVSVISAMGLVCTQGSQPPQPALSLSTMACSCMYQHQWNPGDLDSFPSWTLSAQHLVQRSWVVTNLKWIMFIFPLLPIPLL